jgi:hypothetical protein
MSVWAAGALALGGLAGAAASSSASRKNTKNTIDQNNRAMEQILALPQPAPRDLAGELANNSAVLNEVGQQWTGNANALAGTIGADWRAQNEAANPELYALMRQQDAGPGFTTLNPDDFLAGGRFYQGADGSIGGVGGSGGGGGYYVQDFERLNPMMISNAARPSVSNVGAQQIRAPDRGAVRDVMAQQISAPGAVQADTVSSQDVTAQRLEAPGAVQADVVQAPGAVQAQQLAGLESSALLQGLNTQALGQGYSPLMQQLAATAEQEVALGGRISEQEARNAREGLRTAQVARGIYEGNGAMADEILNLDAVQRQRLNERMAMGLSVQGAQEQALQGMRSFGLGVEGANQAMGQLNTQRGMANQATDLQAQTVNAGNQLTAGMANQDAALRAALANQDVALRTGLANQSTDLQAQSLNANNRLQAGLANQSAGLQAQTVNAGNQLQAGLANQDAALRADLANQGADISVAQMGLSAAQSNQDAALRAALANQSAGLTANQQYLQALLADQSANLSAQQYNSSTALQLSQSAAAGARGAAAQAQANELANVERYLQAIEYNNQLAGQSFEAGQAAVGNRMATQINPYNLALDITNPFNSYAENLNMGNYQGAWSGYNAQANALAGNAAGNAAIAGAGSAAQAGIWGSAIGGLSGIGAAYLGGRGG